MLQLRLERAVNHSGTNFDDQTAQKRRVDSNVQGDVCADSLLKRGHQSAELRIVQRDGGRHLCGHFPSAGSKPAEEGLNDARKGAEPAIFRHQPEEFHTQFLEPGALSEGDNRPLLRATGQNRAMDQLTKFQALGQKAFERLEIACDSVEGSGLEGQII